MREFLGLALIAFGLCGCTAIIPAAVSTAPIWMPVVEAGAFAAGSVIADHFERQNGNAPAAVGRP